MYCGNTGENQFQERMCTYEVMSTTYEYTASGTWDKNGKIEG